MDSNKKITLDKLAPFIKEAERLGCYNSQQTGQIEGVWNLLLKLLKESGVDANKLTVEDMLARYPELLRNFGRTTDTKPATLVTYNSRVKAFLTDFITWNGGDFLAWKESNGKKSAGRTKKAKPQPPPLPAGQVVSPGAEKPTTTTFPISFGTLAVGELKIYAHVSSLEDFKVIWGKVTGLEEQVKAQVLIAPAPTTGSPKADPKEETY